MVAGRPASRWGASTGAGRDVRSRVVVSAALGLVGVVLGIARLALLGWLLARVFAGAGLSALLLPIAAVVTVIAARSLVEYARTMVAHHTAFRVQARLRQRLYDHLVRLGPAYLTHERTGPVATSMVEGVQQLEVYFGQFLPQLVVTVATPILDRKSTRLNSSHGYISYAVFCLKKKKKI